MSQFFAMENEAIELTSKQKDLFNKWHTLSKEQKDTLLEFLRTIWLIDTYKNKNKNGSLNILGKKITT